MLRGFEGGLCLALKGVQDDGQCFKFLTLRCRPCYQNYLFCCYLLSPAGTMTYKCPRFLFGWETWDA